MYVQRSRLFGVVEMLNHVAHERLQFDGPNRVRFKVVDRYVDVIVIYPGVEAEKKQGVRTPNDATPVFFNQFSRFELLLPLHGTADGRECTRCESLRVRYTSRGTSDAQKTILVPLVYRSHFDRIGINAVQRQPAIVVVKDNGHILQRTRKSTKALPITQSQV